MKKLDIGCGRYKVSGAIGIDNCDLENVDIKHDLNKFPWPIENSSFDEIHCYHVLEHVDDVIKTMQEIYRISKNNSIVYIKVPHASCSKSLWSDPTHKRGFTCRSFLDYFNKDAKFGYYSNTDFILKKQKINYCLYNGERGTKIPRWWQSIWNKLANINFETQELFERLIANYIGGFEELNVELIVRK
jgi:ubiquinone/menaquinone biosynthesis C-methylase UbiE